jgi:hypothetical protein
MTRPVPFYTGTFDTSGTNTDIKEHEQIQDLLAYRAEHDAPAPPDEISFENEPNALQNEPGGDATALENLDEDTVAGDVLGDGFKDPNDQIPADNVPDNALDQSGHENQASENKDTDQQ